MFLILINIETWIFRVIISELYSKLLSVLTFIEYNLYTCHINGYVEFFYTDVLLFA